MSNYDQDEASQIITELVNIKKEIVSLKRHRSIDIVFGIIVANLTIWIFSTIIQTALSASRPYRI